MAFNTFTNGTVANALEVNENFGLVTRHYKDVYDDGSTAYSDSGDTGAYVTKLTKTFTADNEWNQLLQTKIAFEVTAYTHGTMEKVRLQISDGTNTSEVEVSLSATGSESGIIHLPMQDLDISNSYTLTVDTFTQGGASAFTIDDVFITVWHLENGQTDTDEARWS